MSSQPFTTCVGVTTSASYLAKTAPERTSARILVPVLPARWGVEGRRARHGSPSAGSRPHSTQPSGSAGEDKIRQLPELEADLVHGRTKVRNLSREILASLRL